jgi:hypothetical protein
MMKKQETILKKGNKAYLGLAFAIFSSTKKWKKGKKLIMALGIWETRIQAFGETHDGENQTCFVNQWWSSWRGPLRWWVQKNNSMTIMKLWSL